jgi:hypothetical protein
MLLGSLVCAFAMLLLGFTRPVASVFTGWDNDSVCIPACSASTPPLNSRVCRMTY